MQLRLISLTTGELEITNIVSKEITDRIHYYTYDGDGKKLYPSKDGKVELSKNSKNQMDQLLTNRRKIKSVETLSSEAFKDISKQVKSKIEKFSYTYVK